MVKQAPQSFSKLLQGRDSNPFAVLGLHQQADEGVVRALLPDAVQAWLLLDGDQAPMQRLGDSALFTGAMTDTRHPRHYQLAWQDGDGQHHRHRDPYSYPPQIADFDLHLFAEGRHWHLYRVLGAQLQTRDGIDGVRFATWAPNAQRISVVGDFNGWQGLRHPMALRGDSGVWELFIPELPPGSLYKFEILGHDGVVQLKTDPYGQQFELRPNTASLVAAASSHRWRDGAWIERRQSQDWLHRPLSILEVHLGSWQRAADGSFLNYRELAQRLAEYAVNLGFTHLELLPVTEHPLDESWGYQCTGYFAPTARHGTPDDFRYFVDHCHGHGLGVLLDWVPGHFPKDSHALARFDGTALYGHADPRQGEHRQWGTLIYNYGRPEVRNFLLASANYWLEEFHLDGLRVDAVASMLYLDYAREAGDWLPNEHGGNENLEAVAFLRELNEMSHSQHPGSITIAEESTSWPQVTRPTWLGGLGFSMKWNMGWMNDTLRYMAEDPIYRQYHHDLLTFGLLYAFGENFCLPFSHDEVVHGKYSLLHKMPGDQWRQFAQLRLLFCYQYTYPGTKLLFMGNEFGQAREWSAERALDWHLLDSDSHRGVQTLVADLNRLYREQSPLHRHSFSAGGFEWIDCHDSSQSVVSYLRRDDDAFNLVVLNFTPVPRHDYRIGVPRAGRYRELLNSDSRFYGGSDVGNPAGIDTEPLPWMGHPHSLRLTLPPLGAIILQAVEDSDATRIVRQQ